MSEGEKLANCPFCGAPAAEIGIDEFITCGGSSDCVGKTLRVHDRKDWNTRATGWHPMTPPRDGTVIQVKIPGHGSDNLIRWSEGFMDEHENPCGCWEWAGDNEPPDCWTDGICWALNEDHIASVQPTEWRLPPTPQGEG